MKKIQETAEKLGKTVDEMAVDVVKVALWLERNKNKGTEAEDLAAAGLDVTLLNPLYVDVWQGVLMHSVPDRRNYFKGWYVRRTPDPWFETFRRRFGIDGAAWRMILDAAHDAALAEAEARRVWRKLEYFAGVELEQVDTLTVAYWTAVADVMGCRLMARHPVTDPLRKMLSSMYSDASHVLREELRYRTKSDPQQDGRSKKKYKAAKEDWAKARDLLAAGTNHFFDADYVLQCMFQDDEPDLTVDFEHLPRMPLGKTPVMWQSKTQVMQTFMQFVSGAAPGSFEAEDVALIVDRVRPLLARAKGQKVDI